jgi:hypothetical protein
MVELVDPADVWRMMLYVLCNPVAAELATAATWPGVTSLHAMLNGTTMKAKRPPWFFDRDGAMPAEVELVLHRPPGFEGIAASEWAARLRAAVAAREAHVADATTPPPPAPTQVDPAPPTPTEVDVRRTVEAAKRGVVDQP